MKYKFISIKIIELNANFSTFDAGINIAVEPYAQSLKHE